MAFNRGSGSLSVSINLSQQQRAEVYSMQAKMDMAWLFENRYDLSEDLLLEKIAQAVELRLKALESSEPGLDKFIATSEAFASDAGNWELDVNYSAALQLRKAGAMLWQENLRRFPEDITANQQAGAAYHNLAMAHERQVDYGEAAKWYQWAVDIKSWLLAANGSEDVSLLVDLVTTLSSAADLYEKTGRASDAQASYLKITEIATQEALEYQSDPDLFVKISVAHRKLGNLDKALSLCTAGLEISDTDDDVWNEKGLVYIEKKDYPNALNCFDKAIEYYSIYAAYYRNKAGALYELSRLEDAVKAMEEAYEWGLSDVAVLNDYGFFHARAGYFDEAKTKLEEGLLYAPDDANLNAHLGYVLLNTGNMQGGLDLVEKAISLDANYAKSYFYLACFYSKLGNEGVAFTELQKAVALGFSEKQWAETEPLLANMREDRGRFGKLMKKMK